MMPGTVDIGTTVTRVTWANSTQCELPHLWLRDNCRCAECRVVQTDEKRFMLSSVPAQLRPASAALSNDELVIRWPDGHESRFDGDYIRTLERFDGVQTKHWTKGFSPPTVEFGEFLHTAVVAASAIEQFLTLGALVITNMPGRSGMLERLQPRLGCIRDMPFGRLHEVRVDPGGYNVAHTSLPLPPHNDFASSSWPPSVQGLHMLVNECEGGETVIVDGWAIAEQLRIDHPDMFDVLCQVSVPFRMFDEQEETFAVNPVIRVGADGGVVHLRYSNQLMQTLSPNTPKLEAFYLAYHELSRRLMSEQARVVFRLESEQCLLVAGHRVLHARNGFDPSGRRHLQDAYFEHDGVRNHLTVLKRQLEKAE